MAGFLLATNVVSELVRKTPGQRVVDGVAARSPNELMLSVVTIGELTGGLVKLAPGNRRRSLQRWVEVDLRQQFAGGILPFDQATAVAWGILMGDGDRSGRPRPAVDAQIAATAIHHQLTLATRNTTDFEDLGLPLIDPRLA